MMYITDDQIAAEQQRCPGIGQLQAYRAIQMRQWMKTQTARRGMTQRAGLS